MARKKTVGLIKYLIIRHKKNVAENKKRRKEMLDGYWSRQTSRPNIADRPKPAPNNVSIKSNGVRQSIVINGEETFIVNGKKLKTGTPEYIKAKKTLDGGMKTLDKGMDTLNESMKNMNKTLKDAFK